MSAKLLESVYKKLRAMRVGQEYFISGHQSAVASYLVRVRRELGYSFRTEAREGGRLVVRVG